MFLILRVSCLDSVFIKGEERSDLTFLEKGGMGDRRTVFPKI